MTRSMGIFSYAIFSTLLAAVLSDAATCKPGFRNAVFNSGVNSQPNLARRFALLQRNGVDKWIGYTLDPVTNWGETVRKGQIRMVMDANSVSAAVTALQSADRPDHLVVFNEPDITAYGNTATDGITIASQIQPILDANRALAKPAVLISPALAYPTSGPQWLHQFFAACKCTKDFPIISVHIYEANADAAIGLIKNWHRQFPRKRMWITEISPSANSGMACSLTPQQMIAWQNKVIGWAATQSYIEKVFWNSGEYGSIYSDANTCNPSLTNINNTPRPLLTNYARMCT